MNLSIQILDSPSQLTDRTKDAFYQCIEFKSRSSADWIGVDLSSLDLIDGLGLGTLFAAQKMAALHHKKLILFSPQSHIWQGLKSTGICEVIAVYDSFKDVIQDATSKTFTSSARQLELREIALPCKSSINSTFFRK